MTSVDKFLKHLEEDGSVMFLADMLQEHSKQLKLRAKGRIDYELSIRLCNINRCFILRLQMEFQGIDRVININDATEIPIDEYLDIGMKTDSEFQEYYNGLIKNYYQC